MWVGGCVSENPGGGGRPVDRGVWTAKTVKRPRQQPAHPQYANYWAPLTRKRHTMPHSAQSQHTNYWAPRTRKGHQQEHRPQRPTESSDPTQHAKGRTGDRPGPRKGATTRRNVTQGGNLTPGPTVSLSKGLPEVPWGAFVRSMPWNCPPHLTALGGCKQRLPQVRAALYGPPCAPWTHCTAFLPQESGSTCTGC